MSKFYRILQLTVAIILFITTFFVCWHTTKFDLTEIQLSKWGIVNSTTWIWNSTLVLLGASCYYNIHHYIEIHEFHWKQLFYYIFAFECISIIMLGLIPAGFFFHTLIAYTYFFTTPLMIFMFAFVNRYVLTYQEWYVHAVLSSLMMIYPLIAWMLFAGHAIAETIHSVIFIIWNVYLLKK